MERQLVVVIVCLLLPPPDGQAHDQSEADIDVAIKELQALREAGNAHAGELSNLDSGAYYDSPQTGALADFMHAPPPPHKKPQPFGGVIPILLLAFFGCFIYQTYLNARPQRSRTSDHEESMGLMAFCSSGRASAWLNRGTDMFDRRRDASLAKNDFSRARNRDDDDDDGML